MAIVISDRPGQLANQLMVFANFIAVAIETGVTIINPGFASFGKFFVGTQRDGLCRFPSGRVRVPAGVGSVVFQGVRIACSLMARSSPRTTGTRLVRLPEGASMDLGSQEFIDTAQSSRFLFVQGWLFRHSEGLSRNRDTICRYFRPISRIERVVEEVVDRARQRGQTLVGVHIRQGDYAKHLGGRYFFDLDTYLDKIQELADVLSDKDPVFLVSSDQPLSTESFKGLPVDLATGHFVSDLYSLASCDLLVGPPSSFTMWASFYGGTPLGFITDRRKRAPLPEEMDVFPTISDKQVHDLYLIS